MRYGKCRSCGSLTVFAKEDGIKLGDGVMIYTSWLTSAVQTMDFICTSCGYFEHYVVDQKKLADVAKAWTRVGAQGPSPS